MLVAETASVYFRTLALCFPLIAISLLPFNADRFRFTSAPRGCSCHSSLISGLENASPRLLVEDGLYHGF